MSNTGTAKHEGLTLQFSPSPSLLPQIVEKLEEFGLHMRSLALEDFDHGYLALLAGLTEVGTISKERFQERFEYLRQRPETYRVLVVQSLETSKVVASGTLLIERKFIRDLGTVAHIEDIVVSPEMRGKSLGRLLIEQLVAMGASQGSYKTILACSESNQGFYCKCGFTKKEVLMDRR